MKSPFIIPIERLHSEDWRIEGEFPPDLLDLVDEEHEFTFEDPVRATLRFQLIGQEILGTGALDTAARTVCVRCLTPTRVELHVPVHETWFHASHERQLEDEVTAEHFIPERSYEGDELNAGEDLRELIMCELPERAYCQPHCKGLCPGCGANLNSEPCACHPAPAGQEADDPTPEWKKKLKNIKLER